MYGKYATRIYTLNMIFLQSSLVTLTSIKIFRSSHTALRCILSLLNLLSTISMILLMHNGKTNDGYNICGFNKDSLCMKCLEGSEGYSHCFACDACVWRKDHHCPWFGVCIGGSNFHYFITYLFSSAAGTYFLAFSYRKEAVLLIAILFFCIIITFLFIYYFLVFFSGSSFIKFFKKLNLEKYDFEIKNRGDDKIFLIMGKL